MAPKGPAGDPVRWLVWSHLLLAAGCSGQADTGAILAQQPGADVPAAVAAPIACRDGWWATEVAPLDTQFYDAAPYVIAPLADGGLAVAGSVYDDPGFSAHWLQRVDAAGTALWEVIIQTSDFDELRHLEPLDAGGLLVVGRTGYNAYDNDVVGLRVDGAGEVVWEATYGGARDETWSGVTRLAGDDLIVAGAVADHFPLRRDAWLMRLDAKTGEQTWERTYEAKDAAIVYDAVTLDDITAVAGQRGQLAAECWRRATPRTKSATARQSPALMPTGHRRGLMFPSLRRGLAGSPRWLSAARECWSASKRRRTRTSRKGPSGRQSSSVWARMATASGGGLRTTDA
ncbi:MAG: hypothetical protein ACI9WU_003603 [Myxococcota bacterium]